MELLYVFYGRKARCTVHSVNTAIDCMRKEIVGIMESERANLLRYACYHIGNLDDAEDIIQNVYSRVCFNDDLRADADAVRRYLFRSVYNACVDHARSSRSFLSIPLGSVRESEFPSETMDSSDDFESEFNRITILLAMIPEEQAEVIRLRTIGGLQFGDIAQMTGLPESTVKSRFKYGIEKVRKLLDLKMPESHYFKAKERKQYGLHQI